MNDVLVIVIAVAVIAVSIFTISLIMELKKTVAAFRKTAEEKLDPVLEEVSLALQSVRKISDNVVDVTEDVKGLSRSVGEMGHAVSAINKLVGSLGSYGAVRAASLQAGVNAALQYFITNLLRKGDYK